MVMVAGQVVPDLSVKVPTEIAPSLTDLSYMKGLMANSWVFWTSEVNLGKSRMTQLPPG